MGRAMLKSRLISFIPLIIGLLILVIILLLTPWGEVLELLDKITLGVLVILGSLSLIYYLSKAVRFWYILRLLEIRVPIKMTSLLYLSGQTISVLPAGELYRSVLLKKHFGVSMSKSAPSVTIQGLVEAIVLLALSLIGAFIIGQSRISVAIVGLSLLFLIVGLRLGWFSKSHLYINKLPYISVNQEKFRQFVQSNRDLLAPKPLVALIAFSLIPVFAGVAILYISSRVVGFDITFIQSMIGYSLPVVVSGLSFLPGGLGVSEGGSIGLVQLFGATAAAAITITLLVRVFTLVAGIVFGTIAQLILYVYMRGKSV